MTGCDDPGRRDCNCLRANHQHGTRGAYHYDRCRGAACTAANAAWAREYRRIRAEHAWNGTSAWADATGTRRRMQALAADGWSPTVLGAHLGISDSGVRWLRTVEGVCLARTAGRVRDLYERLWWTTPTGRAVARTAAWAERAGWVASWRWEGINIDDPAAVPAPLDAGEIDDLAVELAMHGQIRLPSNSPERFEVIRRLAADGYTDPEIADRIGATTEAVCTYRRRKGIPAGVALRSAS